MVGYVDICASILVFILSIQRLPVIFQGFFFARDGVHLADIDIDMMLFQFRDCIESLL